jgi:hypothetical protein
MKTTTNRLLTNTLRVLCCVAALTACSSWGVVVTWEFNPTGANGPVGAAFANFTQGGGTITARGYNNVSGTDTSHDLFFKNTGPIGGASEHGLGITGTTDNELQAGNPIPHYIQLDLRSIIAQGFTGFQLSVGSVQSGETFLLFGSNTQGTLGTQIGGSYGASFDDHFVAITGNYQFISVAAGSGDVLPVAFRAMMTPVPEMSALFPIIGLIAAVSFTRILRRRRASQTALNA